MQAKVSFTQKVKEELTTLTFSDEHMRALLSAFVRINGSLSFSEGTSRIILRTENAKIAKFIYHSIDRLYGIVPKFAYSKTMNFKKRLSCINCCNSFIRVIRIIIWIERCYW